jgi:hypothetical protein
MVLRDKAHPVLRSRVARTALIKGSIRRARHTEMVLTGTSGGANGVAARGDRDESGRWKKVAVKQKTQTIREDHPGLCSSAVTSELITSK